jgi:defect-in-organelle-trafficking protein DotB
MAGSEAAQAIVTSGQDFDFSYELGEKEARKRFRVNATAVARGRSTAVTVSLRAVPGRPPKLSELDIEPDLKPHLCPGDGLVLITGVMGSGKSTLAASILRDLAEKGGRHIASYEAPVEFDLTAGEGLKGPVEQSEIPAHLPSFSAAPRNAARRAADVIFLGESRDRRALRSLIEAAGLGALAYTTAHTRGAAETPLHLINLFQASERAALAAELISVLKVIVQQRLFPRIGGGRVAVREYVILDQPARRKLLNLAPARLEAALAEQLAESGQSLTEAASKKAEEGLIDPGIVRILRAERGGR